VLSRRRCLSQASPDSFAAAIQARLSSRPATSTAFNIRLLRLRRGSLIYLIVSQVVAYMKSDINQFIL
jgi:hypothetical protein